MSGQSFPVAKFPFPYKAAIAISNDCEFMDLKSYKGLSGILHDPAGLDLEITSSIFFYVTNAICHSSVGYFQGLTSSPSEAAPALTGLVRSGWIDTVHAYGDFDRGGFDRRMAESVANVCLKRNMCLPVWTNHGSSENVQNIGHRALTNYQRGDDVDHPAYHLDLARLIGVRYFWVDNGLISHPASGDPVLYQAEGRDGSTLRLFNRYRGLAGKAAPNLESLAEQMTPGGIDAVIEKEAACIYYQHLGVARKNPDGSFDAGTAPFFDGAGLAALQYLSAQQKAGQCLVAGVGRLLRYLDVRERLHAISEGNSIVLYGADSVLAANDLCGIGVRLPKEHSAEILVLKNADGRCIRLPARRQAAHDSSFHLLHVPWTRLEPFEW